MQTRRTRKTKRLTSILWLLGIIGLTTCAGLDNINIDVQGETTIPKRTLVDDLIGELAFIGFDGIDITQSQRFQNEGYTKDQIDSVRLAGFQLRVESPESGNFDFLESISFFVEAEGQPRVKIAEFDPIPDGKKELDLQIEDVELRPYIVAPSVTITTSASGLRPEEETKVIADLVFNVDINVSGALGCSVSKMGRK